MLAYAVKRGCTEVILLYPNLSEEAHTIDRFTIESGFDGNDAVSITAMEFPFWSCERFEDLESAQRDFLDGFQVVSHSFDER